MAQLVVDPVEERRIITQVLDDEGDPRLHEVVLRQVKAFVTLRVRSAETRLPRAPRTTRERWSSPTPNIPASARRLSERSHSSSGSSSANGRVDRFPGTVE